MFLTRAALQKCYENHDVLHRDISANNLMFKRGTEAVRNGILIDFDFAIRGTEHREIAKAERSVRLLCLNLYHVVSRFSGNCSVYCT